jgi:glycosyltransferase involved in cell wall biosynthesis
VAPDAPVICTLVTGAFGRGQGTGGYAVRLRRALEHRGHTVHVVAPGQPTRGVTIGLDRVPHMDVLRLGGGWHTDARRALHRFPWTADAWRDRRAVRTAGVVVVNSVMVQRALSDRGIRAVVVRTGVDTFRPVATGPRSALLFAAHGWRRKNFRTAMRVAARFPDRPVWVAGRDGARRRRLWWARRFLGDRLVDHGPTADLRPLLDRAALVLHPTRYDPASNLVLEAMAAGVPVLTTRCDGSAELLPAALVAPDPTDVDDLVVRARDALAGGRTLGAALRATAEDWPDSRNAERLDHLITRMRNGQDPYAG